MLKNRPRRSPALNNEELAQTSEVRNHSRPQDQFEYLSQLIDEVEATLRLKEDILSKRPYRHAALGLLVAVVCFAGNDHFIKLMGIKGGPSTDVGGSLSVFQWVSLLAAAYAILSFIYFVITVETSRSNKEAQLNTLHDRMVTLLPRPTNQPNHFDSLATINIEKIASYYELVRVHVSRSYIVAIGAGVVGLVVVVVAVAMKLLFQVDDKTTILLTSVGALNQGIGAYFYHLYSHTTNQMNKYHENLLKFQNTLMEYNLIDQVGDIDKRTELISRLLLSRGRQPQENQSQENSA